MLQRVLTGAVRRLRRAPAFTAAAAMTLTIGIGATTAIFGLVDTVLLKPLPYPDPDRLVVLTHTLNVSGATSVPQTDASFLQYRDAPVFDGVAAYRTSSVNLGGAGLPAPLRASAAEVSASTFSLLGVHPLRGRLFERAEDLVGQPPTVLLGERLWRAQFGGDASVVGRLIDVDGVQRAVAGIVPRSFHFPDAGTQLWLPLAIDPAHTATATFDYQAIARLRPGVGAGAAEAALQRLLVALPDVYPGRLTKGAIEVTHMRAVVTPLRDVVIGDAGRSLWPIFGAAAFLLLIACANVANLFLIRAEARRHELAVRRALGAGRATLTAEHLSEAVLIAGAGGSLGLLLAAAATGWLRSRPDAWAIPRLADAHLDPAILAVAAGTSVLAALAVSAVPALRREGALTLLGTMRPGMGTPVGHRVRRTLAVLQVALALVLVTGAGLMMRSFQRLAAVRTGFDPAGARAFRVALPAGAYPRAADAANLLTSALARIGALPGVRAVGAITTVPLDAEGRGDTAVFVDDNGAAGGGMAAPMPNVHQIAFASPGAFAALGIPLLAGRTFAPPDPAHVEQDVIVTSAFVRRYWKTGDALGKQIRLTPFGAPFTIIGVTGDLHATRLEDPPDEMVFLPLVTAPGPATADGGPGDARFTPRDVAVVVRGDSAGSALDARVQGIMRDLAPESPIYRAATLADIVSRATARTAFTTGLLALASLAALVLGAVGFYGVIAYMVSLRRREIAVRLAIGARPADVRRMVTRQAAALAGAGIALGIGAAVALTRFLAGVLYDVAPTDPAALGGAALVMIVVAVAASWVPAHRAAAVDPAQALRSD